MRVHLVSPWIAVVALLAVACGSGGGSNQASSSEPLQPTVSGLVVLGRNIAASSGDALGAPPPGWAPAAESAAFDRAVAHADWTVTEQPDMQGVTSADGRFEVAGLPPGRYTLALTKTLDGNLIPVSIPFVVPTSGEATVVAELELGLVRTALRFNEDGRAVTEVYGPYGARVLMRDGVVTELGDQTRSYQDPDGDGRFVRPDCSTTSWLCAPGTACADGQLCACVSSCPFCEDCPLMACVPASTAPPYACSADNTCAQPGDHCVCVASCPECDDCPAQACTPGCAPVEITALTVTGVPAQLVVGRETQAAAVAAFSDGSTLDVTQLVDWHSADSDVASIDSWGRITAGTAGKTEVRATLGGIDSEPVALTVVERAALQSIRLENAACLCGPVPALPSGPDAPLPPCLLADGVSADLLPVPMCTGVMEVGRTIPFRAIGAFADGSYEDLTAVVEWSVTPSSVGQIEAGLFTALGPGTASIGASLGSVTSDTIDIRVVAQPTVVAVSIYPDAWSYTALAGGPIADASGAPCFDCESALSVLQEDAVQFRATAHYDTGEWRDVTLAVAWRSSAADVAAVDTQGQMVAVQAGKAIVDAVLDGVVSNPVSVQVVDHATLQTLSINMDGTDRVVAVADQRFFHATGYYDVGFGRDVTEEVTWRTSDDSIGTVDNHGVFVGVGAGVVDVWAELDGRQSARISLEVYATSELAYCDPLRVNRAVWQDAFNRVVLESDCASYVPSQQAELRYTVTETQPHGGIFDPCLDLYVYQGDRRVRTIREEGCGDPFVAAGAPGREEAVLKYQLRAAWDLKDDSGASVAPGTYTIFGRFYLYYDPVVSLPITVLPSSRTASTGR